MQQFGVHLCDEGVQFVNRVQHLDTFGVRVESHFERTRHGRDPSSEFLLGILETFGYIVDGLVFLVLVRLDGCRGRFEWSQLRFVAQSVQQFTVGRKQTGTVGLDIVAASLLAQTELNGEPVNLCGG